MTDLQALVAESRALLQKRREEQTVDGCKAELQRNPNFLMLLALHSLAMLTAEKQRALLKDPKAPLSALGGRTLAFEKMVEDLGKLREELMKTEAWASFKVGMDANKKPAAAYLDAMLSVLQYKTEREAREVITKLQAESAMKG